MSWWEQQSSLNPAQVDTQGKQGYQTTMKLFCFGNSILCFSKRVGIEELSVQHSSANPSTLKDIIESLSCSSMTVDEAYSFHYQQKDRYHRRRNALLHRQFAEQVDMILG